MKKSKGKITSSKEQLVENEKLDVAAKSPAVMAGLKKGGKVASKTK